MGVKNKNNNDLVRQRGLRGKMGIPLQRYDDSAYNNLIKKSHKWRPIKSRTSQIAQEPKT